MTYIKLMKHIYTVLDNITRLNPKLKTENVTSLVYSSIHNILLILRQNKRE